MISRWVRSFFRFFNPWMISLWQQGLGPQINIWPQGLGRFMVITTTGRKSGKPRQTPVNYAPIGDSVFCAAGFGSVSDWYRNLQANSGVEVWLPDARWPGTACEIPSTHPNYWVWLRTVLKNSGFAAFAAGINPYWISDERLKTRCKDYHLVQISPKN